jgi:hypothetical protein
MIYLFDTNACIRYLIGRGIALLELPLHLNPSDQELLRDFFVPALTHAFRYDRGVGYFARRAGCGWRRRAGLCSGQLVL